MADFDVAFNWMIDNEDVARAYKTVPDCGGFAIAGVNSAAWPAQFAAIDSAPYKEDRAGMVEAFYREHFWNKWYEQLKSDEVAKRVFDMAVNGGAGTAVKLLQRAVNWVGDPGLPMLSEDGQWGPHTVAQVNACGDALVGAFSNQRIAHYRAIVAANPDKAKYLAGWIARAKK